MANKEIYSLGISIKVDGDSEAKKKISNLESATEKVEKKFKNLSKLTASPTSKIKDLTTPIVEKIESKAKKLNSTSISPTVKLIDGASSKLKQISTTIQRLDNANITANLRINDQTSTYLNKVNGKSGQLKDTSVNPTAEFSDSNLDISKIGNKISSVGDSLNTRVTLPLIGLSAAAAKVGMDFESQMSRVKAISGATGNEFEKLHDQALQLGADTAFSAKQAAEGMENLASAGFSTSEIMSAMPGLLDLAASSGESLASSSDIAASTLRGFGLAASDAGHVADVLAKNASATNAAVVDTGEAMKYIAPVAQTAGWSLESVAASIGELANSGIKGSQAGTTLRAMFSRLAKPSDESAKAMKAMGFNAYDSQHKMKSLSEVISDLSKSTAKMTDEQKQNTIAQVFGEEAMSGILTLIKNGSGALDDLTNSYIHSDGAAKEMASTMQDNAKSAIEQMTGSLETAGIKLEEAFAPKITEAANYVQDLANKFSELSPQQQDFYVKMALGAAAIGPVTKLIGGITSAIGGLISVGSKAGGVLPALFTPVGLAVAGTFAIIGAAAVTESNLMKKSITTTTEELSFAEKVMNKLNGGIYKSKKEMVEAGLIYDDFGDGVSDSFKKGAQDASKSLLKIEMDLKKLNRNGISDESGINNLKNYVNEVTYENINAIKEQRSKIQSEFQKTFSLDGVTSDTEQKVMDSLGTFFETGTNKQLEIRDEIYQFASDKIKEHGKLLDEDLKEIQDKIAKAKALELEYTKAQNAYDQAFAKSQFNNDASKITGIDGASELLQERAKNHQSELDKIDNNYKGTLAYYESLLSNPNLSEEERNNFQNGYDSAKSTRDQAVQKENEGYASDREVIYSHYDGARGMLNEKTGAKFSDADITAHKGTDYLKNHFQNLDQITQEGWYRIKNTTSGEMEDIYATVDKDTGEISGAWSKTAGWSGGYTDELKQKVKELGETHEAEKMRIQNSLSALTGSTLDANNQVISSTGAVIGQLQGVQGATGEAITGIININGTPMQITSNASGQITEMHEFKGSMDDISPSKDVHINSNANEARGEVDGTTNAINSMPNEKTITITTIFKKITQWFDEKFDSAAKVINDHSTAANYTPTENASGTDYATAGLSTVNERGWELSDRTMPIIGQYNDNPLVNLQRGTKIKNHMDSMSEMKADVKQEVANQIPQQKVQVYQPQLAVAGGGNNFSFSMGGININNMADKAAIVKQATQEFAKQFMEVLNNQA